MPIVANPAAPFAPGINEKFAATEQFNKIFPTLAGLYEAAGRNYTQASAQTAQNQTSASAVSAGLQARKQGQDAEIEAQREQQHAQQQAMFEMQQRAIQGRLAEQQMENDRYNFAITRQEEMENTARQNGLVEIEKQRTSGILTDQQAGDARYQLITKIKAFDNRKMSQQAKQIEQQTEMQRKAFEDNQKNITLAQQFGKQSAGHNWIPIVQHNGDTEFYGYDAQKGTFYQIGKRTAANEKGEDQQMAMGKEWAKYTDKHGEFDYAAALKRSKDFAAVDFKDPKSDAAQEWIRENVKGIKDEWDKAKEAMQGPKGQPQQAPVEVPQATGQNVRQDQGPSIQKAVDRLAEIQKQYPDKSKAPPEIRMEIQALMALRNQLR